MVLQALRNVRFSTKCSHSLHFCVSVLSLQTMGTDYEGKSCLILNPTRSADRSEASLQAIIRDNCPQKDPRAGARRWECEQRSEAAASAVDSRGVLNTGARKRPGRNSLIYLLSQEPSLGLSPPRQ